MANSNMANENKLPVLGFVFDILDILIPALVLVSLIFVFFFRTAAVDGRSMNDTLADKDRLIVSDFMYQPQRGDIVIVNRYHKGDEVAEEPLIKRVIGLPGDTVEVMEDKVVVNGKEVDEPYIHYPNLPSGITCTVPKGEVFVMGDHRDNSSDSRFFGTFKIEDLSGKAIFRYLPFDTIGNIYSNMNG